LLLNAVLLCAVLLGARRQPLSIDIFCPPGPQQQPAAATYDGRIACQQGA